MRGTDELRLALLTQLIRTAPWLTALLLAAGPAPAQPAPAPASPADMFAAWCARCHGEDGRGRVANPTVKTQPMDFTDCAIATSEPDADWELVIARGGPAAGLSAEMPAFGDALDRRSIRGLVEYLRSFCREPGWPHGNLNLPRPIVTEKAFPENELVVLPAVAHERHRPWAGQLRVVFERRFGRRSHGEIGVPLESIGAASRRTTGLGDVTLAAKHVLHARASPEAGRIVTAGLEVSLPTGKRSHLGAGAPVAEPYLAFGLFRGPTHLQSELAVELPLEGGEGEVIYNLALGRDLAPAPSTWTIGIELNGSGTHLALTPLIRKGVTSTGALAVATGVRVPIVHRDTERLQWVGYLLWDYLEPVRARR